MLFLFSTALLFCMMFYVKNSAGYGVTLPYNLMLLIILGAWLLFIAIRNKFHIVRARHYQLFLVGSGAICLTWLPAAYYSPGVIILCLAIFIWSILYHQHFTEKTKSRILAAVFILALFQAALCLLQSFFPNVAMSGYEFNWLKSGGRPYGIFQQINLLASFLASGLGCGFLLLMQRQTRLNVFLILTGSGILSFVLAVNQSRTGALGAAVVVLLLAGLLWRDRSHRILSGLAVIILGSMAGYWCVQHISVLVNGVPYSIGREFADSNHERWNIMLITLKMIAMKPFLGWGYGSFEYEFSRYVITHPELPYRYSSIVTHPHNEVLNLWFQGGIIALTGVILLVVGWIKTVVQALKQSRIAAGYAILILPLLVHLNLEYPFYQSFFHLALFVLLLRFGVRDTCETLQRQSPVSVARRLCYGLVGTVLVAFSLTGLYANWKLTLLERQGLVNFPSAVPWYFASQFERAEFDAMVSLLMRYNRTHDVATLDEFMQKAESYSLRHNDQHLWQSQLAIEKMRGNSYRLLHDTKIYHKLFPTRQHKLEITRH